jgi:hypothetical protein
MTSSRYGASPANLDQSAALARFRGLGIRSVELRLAPGACAECVRVSEQGRHPIDFAPPLPVVRCRREVCRCTYVAVEPPDGPRAARPIT